jgi:hypothetical protein
MEKRKKKGKVSIVMIRIEELKGEWKKESIYIYSLRVE